MLLLLLLYFYDVERITYALLYNLLARPYIREMTFDQQRSAAAVLKNKTEDVTRPMNGK